MGLRRNSREWTLQFLFQHEFETLEQNIEDQLNKFNRYFSPQPEEWEYAKTLIVGIVEQSEKLDELITTKLENWKLSRIAKVDLILMRMGTFEISTSMTPFAVVLNEVLEIAKKFSSSDSHTFINGVLDKVAGDFQK